MPPDLNQVPTADDATQAHMADMQEALPGELDSSEVIRTPPVIRWINNVLDVVLGASIIAELVILMADSISRTFFSHSLAWSDELASVALGVVTFVGGAVSYQRGYHVTVKVLLTRLPKQVSNYLEATSTWFVLLLAVVAGYVSLPIISQKMSQLSPILGFSEAWFFIPIPIGAGLIVIYAASRLWYVRPIWQIPVGAVPPLIAFYIVHEQFLGVVNAFQSAGEAAGILLVVFAVLLLIGVPIAFVMMATAALYMTAGQAAPLQTLPSQMQDGVSGIIMLAIPFFVLAGLIMTYGGLSKRLADAVSVLFRRVPGAPLHVTVVTMYLFSGISGSKLADISAVGSTMTEIAEQNGYSRAESAAVLAASASMGETIPPSTALIIIASLSSLSISTLFLAGLLPAAVVAAAIMLLILVREIRRSPKRGNGAFAENPGWKKNALIVLNAIPALCVPVILVGGIVSAIATPTEVSAFAVIIAIVFSMILTRSFLGRQLASAMRETINLSGMLLFILAASTALAWTLTILGAPQLVANSLSTFKTHPVIFILLMIVALVVLGAVMEGIAAIIVMTPILLPAAADLGINSYQAAIVMLIAMGVGSLSPPIGVGFFAACTVTKSSFEKAARAYWPYLIALGAGLVALAFFPWFTELLPRLLLYNAQIVPTIQ
jgi:tripartite ATP-independent transporter DctM subunit